MTQPNKSTPKPAKASRGGRKSTKKRSHISLSDNLNRAASYLGAQTFGNKTAYLEHLILRDLERQGMTIPEILKLADEWEKANG